MKKAIVLIILGIFISAVPCSANPAGGGGFNYGGDGIGTNRVMQQKNGIRQNYGMNGSQRISRNNNGNYYYRPVERITPVIPAYGTKEAPIRTISCLGTSSRVNIGSMPMACNSAAATRVKLGSKNTKTVKGNKISSNSKIRRVSL